MGPESLLRRNAAWLLVTVAYLYVFPYFERLNNPNENARIWATRAIVEHHELNIDRVEREWGWVNDKAKNAHHVYSGKAPGTSFLGVPVLYAETSLRRMLHWPPASKREVTFWLRLFAVKIPLCIFLWFFARHVQRLTASPLARDLLVVGLGLGTLLYPYGTVFEGHALAAAAAFSAYMVLVEARRNAVLAWAGFLAGLAVLFEYQAVLVAAALAAYTLYRDRMRAALFFAGALPPAAALAAYHTVLFGRPWRFPFGNVENPVFAATAHAAGFHGLSLPKLYAIKSFLFSVNYGLFAFSPILALGAVAALVMLARGPRREAALVVGVCTLMFLFLAGMSNWRAGWCVGPRYITTVAPFLAGALAAAWPAAARRPWFTALAAGLIISSVFLNVVSGAVYPHYPEQLDNPVFDLTLPLLADGYVPYSVGWFVGLRGLVSLVPLAAVVVAVLALGVGGDDRRPGRWLVHGTVAIVVAAAFLAPLSSYGRKPDPGEAHAIALVRSFWEPPRK